MVYLGEFEIQLQLAGQGESHDHEELYRIVAVDPHPATSDESVTHPHVRDECLCAGEAGAAICSALTSGRICDFFLLVRSVLKEYNPKSPFVPLDKWNGICCVGVRRNTSCVPCYLGGVVGTLWRGAQDGRIANT